MLNGNFLFWIIEREVTSLHIPTKSFTFRIFIHIQHILTHSHNDVILCMRRKIWMCMTTLLFPMKSFTFSIFIHIQYILTHSHKDVIIRMGRKIWMCMMCSHSNALMAWWLCRKAYECAGNRNKCCF